MEAARTESPIHARRHGLSHEDLYVELKYTFHLTHSTITDILSAVAPQQRKPPPVHLSSDITAFRGDPASRTYYFGLGATHDRYAKRIITVLIYPDSTLKVTVAVQSIHIKKTD